MQSKPSRPSVGPERAGAAGDSILLSPFRGLPSSAVAEKSSRGWQLRVLMLMGLPKANTPTDPLSSLLAGRSSLPTIALTGLGVKAAPAFALLLP